MKVHTNIHTHPGKSNKRASPHQTSAGSANMQQRTKRIKLFKEHHLPPPLPPHLFEEGALHPNEMMTKAPPSMAAYIRAPSRLHICTKDFDINMLINRRWCAKTPQPGVKWQDSGAPSTQLKYVLASTPETRRLPLCV